MQKITKKQENFITRIVLSNTQGSSFQRACVYKKGVSKEEKQGFVDAFHGKLKLLNKIYNKKVSEEDHIKNIEEFKKELSEDFPKVLTKKRMCFGTAQKAVNLYLKFLWCLGDIEEPPHCPIDGIVLTEIGSNVKWTKLDNVEEYRKIIDSIRDKAKKQGQSIAEWELNLW